MKKRAQATNLLEQVFKNKEVKPIYKIPWTTVTIDGIRFGRNFGKWKCLNCKNSWSSAYTWISTNFCLTNNVTFKDNKDKLWFSGKGLIYKEFLIEKCKNCSDGNNTNVIVTSYNNLEGSNYNDNRKPHNANLCVKCQKGYPCQKWN
jgi:hypothetical protein